MTETPEGCLNVQKLYNANTGYVVDRPLLNTKSIFTQLYNSSYNMWFIIRSNSFTVWDISFILQKLLHSSMIPFPLINSGVSSLNLHEYVTADVSTASIFFSRRTDSERERERKRERQTDRETDSEKEREIETDSETRKRERERERGRERDRQTDSAKEREGETDRQRERERE